jgi:hypothetical protein
VAAIDDAIDRLVAAFRGAQLPPVRPPADPGPVLAAVALEIAPLRLPEQLRTFWRRVDARTLAAAPTDPPATAPAAALDTWRRQRAAFPGTTPRLLLPVCSERGRALFVELDRPDGPGGACFGREAGDAPFELRHRDLAGYLDLHATLVEAGRFGGDRYGLHPQEWDDARRVRLPASAEVAPYGRRRTFEGDVARWPAHWLPWEGPAAGDRDPLGADATIEGLTARASATRRPVSGRIHARVVGLATSAAGRRASVADASGVLDVWCPAEVCVFGPVLDRSFEFEVTVQPDGRDQRARPRGPGAGPALRGDPGEPQDLAARLYAEVFETDRGAEASAVRPLG